MSVATWPPNRCRQRRLAAILLVALTASACTAGGAITTSSPASAGPSSPPPSAGSSGPADGPDGTPGPGNPGDLVVPQPGQLDVHPIAADSFAAMVEGRHAVLTITYTSGVPPCAILDSVIVRRGQGTIAITLREGHGPGNQVCIMLAMVMQTGVDLGELDPGRYIISDITGGADPIQVIIG